MNFLLKFQSKMTILAMLLTMALLSRATLGQGPPSSSEADAKLYDECASVISAIVNSAHAGDSTRLMTHLDSSTKKYLQQDMKRLFGGSKRKLRKFFHDCWHPARFLKQYGCGGVVKIGDLLYVKMILTDDYSSMDGRTKPAVENKCVEMWVGFTRDNGQLKAHFEYPLYDIIYLMQ